MDILLLNGPNLNLLGSREKNHYGCSSLEDIVSNLKKITTNSGLTFEHYQSNSEEKLIEKIHKAGAEKTSYIIINPAAFTHTSIALRDALLAVGIEFTEIHLSNIYKREDFRQKSYFSNIAKGTIVGFGAQGYELAINAAIQYIKSKQFKEPNGHS
jgi:3-dehydroquinate dehydratase-2